MLGRGSTFRVFLPVPRDHARVDGAYLPSHAHAEPGPRRRPRDRRSHGRRRGPAHAKPPKPKAELVTKQPAAKFGSGKISAGAFVKNRGNKKAKASVATFYLSTDKTQSSDDKALGTARVGKIKPKKFKQVSGIFAVPASVATGTYHVVVCADTGRAVKERKESNNCKGSKGTVAVTATGPPKQVTISYAVAHARWWAAVSGSATNGTCTDDLLTGGGSCVVTPASAPSRSPRLRCCRAVLPFQSWSGAVPAPAQPTHGDHEPEHEHRLHGELRSEPSGPRVVRRQQLVDAAHPAEGRALVGAEVALRDDPVELVDQRVVEAVRVQQRDRLVVDARAAAR